MAFESIKLNTLPNCDKQLQTPSHPGTAPWRSEIKAFFQSILSLSHSTMENQRNLLNRKLMAKSRGWWRCWRWWRSHCGAEELKHFIFLIWPSHISTVTNYRSDIFKTITFYKFRRMQRNEPELMFGVKNIRASQGAAVLTSGQSFHFPWTFPLCAMLQHRTEMDLT